MHQGNRTTTQLKQYLTIWYILYSQLSDQILSDKLTQIEALSENYPICVKVCRRIIKIKENWKLFQTFLSFLHEKEVLQSYHICLHFIIVWVWNPWAIFSREGIRFRNHRKVSRRLVLKEYWHFWSAIKWTGWGK